MSKVAVITDSLANMPSELEKEYGIRVVPQGFTMDGKTYRDRMDLKDEEFWRIWKSGKSFSTNAAVPGDFMAAYQDAAKETDTMVCVVASKAMSATYQSAIQARELMKMANGGLTIEVIDSKYSSGALAFIVVEAARAARAGKSLTEIIQVVQEMIGKVKSICGMETLKGLIRSGRFPIKVYTKELRGVRPLVGMISGSGLVDNLGTVKGKQKCFQRLTEMIGEYTDASKPLHVIVQYTDNMKDGQKLIKMVKAKYNCAEIYLAPTSQNSCGHSGPSYSISFFSG
jgi:DegV family protein with EDD domain